MEFDFLRLKQNLTYANTRFSSIVFSLISCNFVAHFSSGPKKSELRIGESSAFFTYVKASILKSNFEGVVNVDNNGATHVRMEVTHQACAQQGVNDLQICENGETCESQSQDDLPSSNSIPDSFSIERSCTPPASMEVSQQKHYTEENLHQGVIHPRNGTHCSELEVSGMASQHAYPYYISGVVNHVMMPSSAQCIIKTISRTYRIIQVQL
ncbi:Two-component response regulator APRR1 [Spatholobus suberectus]|nr:Two-component response regulator APRR1 [Spatholobus suberectus]